MYPWRIICLSLLLVAHSVVYSQTVSVPANTFNGINSTQIGNPTSPIPISAYGCTPGSGTTFTYMVTAVDASGGSTAGTSTSFSSSTCSGLSATNFLTLSITAPVGAVSCGIYRTAPTSMVGLVATIPCGGGIVAEYQDVGGTSIPNANPPANNSTGSLKASGTVSALNFITQGPSAGTSDWVQGGSLPLCSTGQAQPCIQPLSFFLQAPSSIPTSFGWTAPSVANTAGSTPLVVNQSANSSQGVPTSTLSYGFTGTGTGAVGGLATYTSSTGTIGNCATLPCNLILGVFNSTNSWISSGETMVTLDATVSVNNGDILCASAMSPGTAHDNGSIACPTGLWVGIVKSSGTTSTPTAFIMLK